jgi:hypothetical protein
VAPAAEQARGQVQMPAGHLGAEKFQAARTGQRQAGAQGERRITGRARRQRADGVQETPVNRFIRRHPPQNPTVPGGALMGHYDAV